MPDDGDAQLARIASVMALALVRDLEETEQIRILDAVGYPVAEIAGLLGKKANTISAALYRQRNTRATRRTTSAKKPTRRKPAGGR